MNADDIIVIVILLPLCLVAGWLDYRYRRLPNWLCAVTALAGLGTTAYFGGMAVTGNHALHLVAALVVGMGLFRLGMIGGGDAKFYAAGAAWYPLDRAMPLLLTVSLAGLVLFLAWFVVRRIQRKPIMAKSTDPFDRLPYGIAIALGILVAAY